MLLSCPPEIHPSQRGAQVNGSVPRATTCPRRQSGAQDWQKVARA